MSVVVPPVEPPIPDAETPSASVAIRGLARPYTVQAFRALLAGAGAGELKDDAVWQNEIRTSALVTVADADTAKKLVSALTGVEFPFASGRKLTASFSSATASEHRATVAAAAAAAKAAAQAAAVAAALAQEEEEYIAGDGDGDEVEGGDAVEGGGRGEDAGFEKRARADEQADPTEEVPVEPSADAARARRDPRDRKLAALVQLVRPRPRLQR